MESLYLSVYWHNRPLTGGEYISLVKGFLHQLSARFSVFSQFYVVEASGTTAKQISLDSSEFDEEVARQLPKEWAYLNDDPRDKSFQLMSRSKMGFSNSFSTGAVGDPTACVVETACGKLDARAANSVIVRLPASLEQPEFVASLFRQTIEYWSATHGTVSRARFDDALDQPVGDIRVGWLTFIPRAEAARYLPAGVTFELCSGGVLVRLSKEIPSETDQEAVAKLRSLQVVLEPLAFLRNPRDAK